MKILFSLRKAKILILSKCNFEFSFENMSLLRHSYLSFEFPNFQNKKTILVPKKFHCIVLDVPTSFG